MAVQYYLKQSDTCGCRYIQTYDPSLDTGPGHTPAAWGSVESFTAPDGRTYTTQRCATHDDVPFDTLGTVLLEKECRRRNVSIKEILTHPKLSHLSPEDLMARAAFAGRSERVLTIPLPELTAGERAQLASSLTTADGRVVLSEK